MNIKTGEELHGFILENSEKIDDIQNSTEVTDEVLGISEIDECEEITKS